MSDVLAACLEVNPASLGERALAERATWLLDAVHRLTGALAATIAEAEARRLTGSRMSPQGLTGAWLAELAEARLSRAETARLVARAKVVTGLPLVAALHAGGEVSTGFLDAAGAGLRQLPDEAVASWDALLAGEGRGVDPADVPKLLAHLKVMIDPDAVSAEAAAADARSELHVSPFGSSGSWAVRGTLHGLEGELFARLLHHYARPRDASDTRSRGERQAAALGQILRIAERSTHDPGFAGAPHGAGGHLLILAKAETWAGAPGAPAATTEQTVVDPGRLEAARCTHTPDVLVYAIGHGEPTDRAAQPAGTSSEPAESTAAADGRLITTVLAGLVAPPLGAAIEPLTYGRGQRTASRAQWFALIARDRHCVTPECTREAIWCEAHHLREWDADRGHTDLDNLGLVCWEHHTWLHRTGQHLHPPWCRCPRCSRRRAAGPYQPHEWLLHTEPPMVQATPAAAA